MVHQAIHGHQQARRGFTGSDRRNKPDGIDNAALKTTMSSRHRQGNQPVLAKTFLRSTEVFTLPVGLGQLIVADVQPWGELMAASLLTALPVIVFYMLGQKFMIAGLTAGSVKG